jgi:hypothetical protein
MKFTINNTAVLASALIYLVAQSAHASQPTQGEAKLIDSGIHATSKPQQPLAMLKVATPAQAAAAARQDQDPNLNGSVSDMRETPSPAK